MVIFRYCSALMLACLLIDQVHAGGEPQRFYRDLWNPTYHTERLSYCTFGDQECGLPVATRFCRMLGYKNANEAIIDHNVGLTNYISSRAQCRGWECDGFKMIRCVGVINHNSPKDYDYRLRRFAFPRFDHYRVDWCYENGNGCGQKAAYSFCRRMGYLRTKGYKKQEQVPATKALGNQKLCFGKACVAFTEITCYR